MPDETKPPENFSPASARLCLEAIIDAIPKSRRIEYFGELNEIGVVLGKLTKLANIQDENKAI